MSTGNLIEGLLILQPFYDKPNGFNTGANHDVIYAYATSTKLNEKIIQAMINLGWHQEHDERDYGEDFKLEDYRQDESWYFYT